MTALVHIGLVIAVIGLWASVWRLSYRLADIRTAINSSLIRMMADLKVAEERIAELEEERPAK